MPRRYWPFLFQILCLSFLENKNKHIYVENSMYKIFKITLFYPSVLVLEKQKQEKGYTVL